MFACWQANSNTRRGSRTFVQTARANQSPLCAVRRAVRRRIVVAAGIGSIGGLVASRVVSSRLAGISISFTSVAVSRVKLLAKVVVGVAAGGWGAATATGVSTTRGLWGVWGLRRGFRPRPKRGELRQAGHGPGAGLGATNKTLQRSFVPRPCPNHPHRTNRGRVLGLGRGASIPEGTPSRAFERFYRTESRRTNIEALRDMLSRSQLPLRFSG